MGQQFDSYEQYGDRDLSGRPSARGFQRRQRGPGRHGPGGHGGWGGHPGWEGWGAWSTHTGHGGPPPWLTGLFGGGRPERGRGGPRVRRGDVRSAILDVLRTAGEKEETPNGYQVIQAITDRSGGVWKPSPGSVYPTVQQLQDEGLVDQAEGEGRRGLQLTPDGARWCTEHADELAAVWVPFDRAREDQAAGPAGAADQADLKSEIGQVMSAVWQIVTGGSEAQRAAAADVLVEARRSLYGILADGPER